MSKSFGLQRKTLARVIGLEKRVDKIESGSGGINIDKFTELNKGILSVNNNLKAIGDALTAELVADKESARDEKNKNKREVDAIKKASIYLPHFISWKTSKRKAEKVLKLPKIPILKNKREKKILLFEMPISISALAKPNPCNNPKQKAISHGDFNFPSLRVISVAR